VSAIFFTRVFLPITTVSHSVCNVIKTVKRDFLLVTRCLTWTLNYSSAKFATQHIDQGLLVMANSVKVGCIDLKLGNTFHCRCLWFSVAPSIQCYYWLCAPYKFMYYL